MKQPSLLDDAAVVDPQARPAAAAIRRRFAARRRGRGSQDLERCSEKMVRSYLDALEHFCSAEEHGEQTDIFDQRESSTTGED